MRIDLAGALLNEKTLTEEGVEVTFATHLLYGSYLMSQLAIPYLKEAAEPRVVMVSSGGMYNTKFPKWEVGNPKCTRPYR
jgi:dehydrogenase/reductase SDR family protein 12